MTDHEPTLAPDEKLCPFCAETIKKAALKCRYCHSELPVEAAPAPPQASSPGRLASGRLTIGLLVLCLLLAGGAFATWWWGQHQDDEEVSGAIGSAQARDAGISQATSLTQKVLSYDWSTLDQDIASTEKVLAPSFRSEYAKTMSTVHDQTIKNQVKLKAEVVASSTVSATADKVVALVFVNQVTTAKGTPNQRLDQNRVLVTLTRHGGEWRVSKMAAF